MQVPKIIGVVPQADYGLEITFDGGIVKRLDIKPYIAEFAPFAQLKNAALFNAVKVDIGGMGIVRNDQIDLSRYDAWEFGV
ncbi:MAG: DUF2442 domain-containing protein [Clostridiales bacterium]|nr:DUF2442 domain-containing protein [Clostridiales bacterium]